MRRSWGERGRIERGLREEQEERRQDDGEEWKVWEEVLNRNKKREG